MLFNWMQFGSYCFGFFFNFNSYALLACWHLSPSLVLFPHPKSSMTIGGNTCQQGFRGGTTRISPTISSLTGSTSRNDRLGTVSPPSKDKASCLNTRPCQAIIDGVASIDAPSFFFLTFSRYSSFALSLLYHYGLPFPPRGEISIQGPQGGRPPTGPWPFHFLAMQANRDHRLPVSSKLLFFCCCMALIQASALFAVTVARFPRRPGAAPVGGTRTLGLSWQGVLSVCASMPYVSACIRFTPSAGGCSFARILFARISLLNSPSTKLSWHWMKSFTSERLLRDSPPSSSARWLGRSHMLPVDLLSCSLGGA